MIFWHVHREIMGATELGCAMDYDWGAWCLELYHDPVVDRISNNTNPQ